LIDGLLYHETELNIQEHYAVTGGYTDQVFGLCHLLGFRFAPRLRVLGDRKLYNIESPTLYPKLDLLMGGTINTKQITDHWDEMLRLTASLRLETVAASLLLRKLASYPRQNGLAWALREVGRLEKTLFTLEWLQSVSRWPCAGHGNSVVHPLACRFMRIAVANTPATAIRLCWLKRPFR
jgi:TnpA family transposase